MKCQIILKVQTYESYESDIVIFLFIYLLILTTIKSKSSILHLTIFVNLTLWRFNNPIIAAWPIQFKTFPNRMLCLSFINRSGIEIEFFCINFCIISQNIFDFIKLSYFLFNLLIPPQHFFHFNFLLFIILFNSL